MMRVDVYNDIDGVNKNITFAILRAAEEAIPKGRNMIGRKIMPWWNEECCQAVKDRNKAFRLLKENT